MARRQRGGRTRGGEYDAVLRLAGKFDAERMAQALGVRPAQIVRPGRASFCLGTGRNVNAPVRRLLRAVGGMSAADRRAWRGLRVRQLDYWLMRSPDFASASFRFKPDLLERLAGEGVEFAISMYAAAPEKHIH